MNHRRLLLFPGILPGVVRLSPVMVVHQEFFVDPIPVEDNKSARFLAIIDDIYRAIDGGNLLAQEVPAEVGLAGWLPTCTGSSIEDDFHYDLLSPFEGTSLLFGVYHVIQYKL
jgi:hypothetical protein